MGKWFNLIFLVAGLFAGYIFIFSNNVFVCLVSSVAAGLLLIAAGRATRIVQKLIDEL